MDQMATKKTVYNVRLIDNGDGTFAIPFAHRFKKGRQGSGEWVDAAMSRIQRLFTIRDLLTDGQRIRRSAGMIGRTKG